MHLTNDVDASQFLARDPSEEEIRKLTVAELRVLARVIGLRLGKSNKEDLVNRITAELRERGEAGEEMETVEGEEMETVEGEEMETVEGEEEETTPEKQPAEPLKELQLKLEIARINLESLKLQKEMQQKAAQAPQPVPSVPAFDVARTVRLVPPFNESNVDDYFRMFEKLAKKLKWPKEYWPVLIQPGLKGRALSVFGALSETRADDYEEVKGAILREYQLVPETYRVRFRSYRKQPHSSYVEYAREKRTKLEQWLRAKQVTEFKDLVELVLVEEFLGTVPKEVSIYVNEKDVADVEEAAILADKYSMARPSTGRFPNLKGKGDVETNRPVISHSPGGPPTTTTCSKKEDGTLPPARRKCQNCGKVGHQTSACWSKPRDGGNAKAVLVAGVERDHTRARRDPEEAAKAVAMVSTCNKPVRQDEPVEVRQVGQENRGGDPEFGTFKPFLSQGLMSSGGGESKRITILRDSGALQTLMLRKLAPVQEPDRYVVVKLVGGGLERAPLVTINLQTPLFVGQAVVGVMDELPVEGVDLLLGNDLVGGKMSPPPIVSNQPIPSEETERLVAEFPELFPVCAVTRGMAARERSAERNRSPGREARRDRDTLNGEINLAALFEEGKGTGVGSLKDSQRVDPELKGLYEEVEQERAKSDRYYMQDGVLMRRWTSTTCPAGDIEWAERRQVVVPIAYREEIMRLGHDSPFAGHLGVRKTLNRIWQHFYWPKIRNDVARYCRTCHTCQLVGRPNQSLAVAPLKPIPVGEEPFSKVMVDIVGPLPKTARGHCYILSIMDTFSRYPEAIPLRSARAKVVIRELVTFFSRYGLPRELQSDQGSIFMSKVFLQSLKELGIAKVTASAYHPQSQGALERYHQTLKGMLKKICLENVTGWDQALPLVLFATREVPNESLGFSPFSLVFGHEVRGPLKVLRERMLQEKGSPPGNLLKSVVDMRDRLAQCWEMAKEHLVTTQGRMKQGYDKHAQVRNFDPGDSVLVLLPIQGNPLGAKFSGPYKVLKRTGDTNYIVATPDRRRSQQLCHVNMLKRYHHRENPPGGAAGESVCAVSSAPQEAEVADSPTLAMEATWEGNAEAWSRIPEKLAHLPPDQREDLLALMQRYRAVFRDTPGKTSLACHDVDVGGAKPIKQPAYRVNPQRAEIIRKELNYLLDNGLIEPTQSEWSSPVTVVPKPDGTPRFCIDYRRVNAVTKKDSYPLPRLEECIDRVGQAKFISKLDLLRGYWQVPMTPRAQEVTCFSTLGRTYKCKVMPFGLTNAPATFQRLMNELTEGVPGCVAYLDDVVVYSDTWVEHLEQLARFLDQLVTSNLVLNLTKCEFVRAKVNYLGYTIGQGEVAPPRAKVEAILNIPVPCNRKEVRSFLGAVAFYRMFICNMATVVAPLTDLLKKGAPFEWNERCQVAFTQLKHILCAAPVLQAPDFNKPFSLYCDASNEGVGAVLLQVRDSVEHPVSYFSKKLNAAQRNYSTIEKELLSIILALQHFAVYVPTGAHVIVFTDHHPLKYVNKFRDKNLRLTRWSLFLQEFNLDVRHVKGKDNVIADWLSRV